MTVPVVSSTEAVAEIAKIEQFNTAPPRLSVKFTELNKNARMPTYGSVCSAGADLYSAEDIVVPAKEKRCISTGLQIELPLGFYGRIAPRSGLAAKHFIDVGAGVIDSDYRGEVKVLLFNFADADFEVKCGDRIAQLICEQIGNAKYEEVKSFEITGPESNGFETAEESTTKSAPTEATKIDERITIRFTQLDETALTPTYGSAEAAGADLYSVENVIIPALGKYCVSTGLQVELPNGYYGRVAPRSELAGKFFIDVGAGVVDSDYRGEVKVLLFNFNNTDFEVKMGDKIAQMIIEKIGHCYYEVCDQLDNTVRGAGGFGSTGESATENEPTVKKPKTEETESFDSPVTILFKKSLENARLPTHGSAEAAGADLYSTESAVVPAKSKIYVSTGIHVKIPYGYYGRVAPRSGLAAKHFIDIGGGIIDSDYRGEVKVLLFNFSDNDFEINAGDRIAQLVCEKIALCTYQKVERLETTDRGAGGFGSTGK